MLRDGSKPRRHSNSRASASALPPIYCPISGAIHPEARVIDERGLAWLKDRGRCVSHEAIAKLEHADVGGLVARLFPHGDRAALETVVKLYLWGFAIDDLIEKEASDHLPEVADTFLGLIRLLDAPASSAMDSNPYAVAFQEICDDLMNLATPRVWRRWVEFTRMFAAAIVWESIYRNANLVPGLDNVTSMRLHSSGAINYGIRLMELTDGYELSDEDLARPDVHVLTDIAAVMLAWGNDIYSYFFEVENHTDAISLVSALMTHHAISPLQALTEAITMHNRAMACYVRHRRHVRGPGDDPVIRYVNGLDQQIRGNLEWGVCRSRRYDTGRHVHELVLCDVATTNLHGCDLTEALTIPSITWWWME